MSDETSGGRCVLCHPSVSFKERLSIINDYRIEDKRPYDDLTYPTLYLTLSLTFVSHMQRCFIPHSLKYYILFMLLLTCDLSRLHECNIQSVTVVITMRG